MTPQLETVVVRLALAGTETARREGESFRDWRRRLKDTAVRYILEAARSDNRLRIIDARAEEDR